MNHDWMIDISVNDKQESAQIFMSSDDSEAHLNQCGESDAILYSEKDEIFIKRVGETPVEIERDGRRKLIKTEHPTRILSNDRICVGASEYHIHGIYRLNQPRRTTSRFGQVANKILLTSAAAIMVAVIPACDQSKRPEITEQPKCENGEIKTMMCFDNNRYQKCGDGRWELVEECKKPSLCDSYDAKINDKYIVVSTECFDPIPCRNGYYTCYRGEANQEIYKCENHKWKLYDICDPEKDCDVDNGFFRSEAKCVNFGRMPGALIDTDDSKFLQKCDSGNAIMNCWDDYCNYHKVCKDNEICKKISDTEAECVPNDEDK